MGFGELHLLMIEPGRLNILNPVLKDNLLGATNGDMNFVALTHSNNAERPFGQYGWEIISNDCLPSLFKIKYL